MYLHSNSSVYSPRPRGVVIPVPVFVIHNQHATQYPSMRRGRQIMTVRPPYRGLGAPLPPQTQSIAQMAAQGAGATASILVAMGTIGGPVGAAAAALAGIGVLIANHFGGCGQTCVQATAIANQLATYWGQNLQAYMSAPVHYRSLQLAALNNFDTGWKALVAGCSDPQLGDAGARCISERQRGGKYDAFAVDRDPIANDPNVVPDPPAAGLLSSVGVSPSATIGGVPVGALLLPAALIAAGVFFA